MARTIESAVAALLWLVVLWRAPAARRSPAARPLWLTFACISAALTISSPGIGPALDRVAGVTQLDILAKHLLGIASAAFLLEFVRTIPTEPGVPCAPAPTRAKVVPILTGVFIVAVFVPAPRREGTDLLSQGAVSGWISAYAVVWLAYLGASQIIATRLFWGHARHCPAGLLRTGLKCAGAGTSVGIVYAVVRVVVALAAGTAWDRSGSGALSPLFSLLMSTSLILIVVGTSLPIADRLVRDRAARDDLRGLDPIWRTLSTANPNVVLPQDGEVVQVRLHRRVVEILDFTRILRAYATQDMLISAAHFAAARGLAGPEHEAAVTAGWLETARRAKARGGGPASDMDQTAGGGLREDAAFSEEVEHLLRISSHYRSGFAADFADAFEASPAREIGTTM